MTEKGAFGITRNDDGNLANLYEWPWYWRYPLAVAGAVGSVWGPFALGVFNHTNWGAVIVTGLCVLACLSLAYETFLLGIFAGIIYGMVSLAQWLFPNVFAWGDNHQGTWQQGLIVGVVVYLFFELRLLKVRANQLEAQNAKLWEEIRSIRYPNSSW